MYLLVVLCARIYMRNASPRVKKHVLVIEIFCYDNSLLLSNTNKWISERGQTAKLLYLKIQFFGMPA